MHMRLYEVMDCDGTGGEDNINGGSVQIVRVNDLSGKCLISRGVSEAG